MSSYDLPSLGSSIPQAPVKREEPADLVRNAYLENRRMQPYGMDYALTLPGKALGKVKDFGSDHWKKLLIGAVIGLIVVVGVTVLVVNVTTGMPVTDQILTVWNGGWEAWAGIQNWWTESMRLLDPFVALIAIPIGFEAIAFGKKPL